MEQVKINLPQDTIAAVSTPYGIGGIAVIRVSGPRAVEIVNEAWHGADLTIKKSHTANFGKYYNIAGKLLDQGVATLFISPSSFTGENTVEISVHGSAWIQKEILADLIKRGCRIAEPGEFTKRAFLNGKLDLAQAEGVADLIASSSKAAHDMAINQIKGSFSLEFEDLRTQLIEFASLLELELDFSEEDVEFADRSALMNLCDKIYKRIDRLANSFSRGAVLKSGVPVVIAGIPNAGKSSLLNLIAGEEKAIVTDIPGTTRDMIEDTVEIDGILYRFIDTAGLRDTSDKVEGIGVARAKEAMNKAMVIIWMIDPTDDISIQKERIIDFQNQNPDKKIIVLINKSDLTILRQNSEPELSFIHKTIRFSTHTGEGLPALYSTLNEIVMEDMNPETDVIVTNARHYESLLKAKESILRAQEAFSEGISSDLIAQDIREATTHLATVTGSITTDTLLHSIFSRFCIGK